jgi:gliding motility associated protien GldN
MNISYEDHYEEDATLQKLQTNQVFSGIDSRKNLFQILFDAAWAGQINVYNSRMSRQYSELEIKGNDKSKGVLRYLRAEAGMDDFEDIDDDVYIDPNESLNEELETKLVPFKSSQIIKYRIVEDWFFDKRRSKMDVRIISISPYLMYTDVEDDEQLASAGTYFYPEIRQLLVNHKIYNEQNMMDRMCFDEYFQRRLFNSVIVKESNVYDREIDKYIDNKNSLAQLLEAEKIKENIRTYEHNAWEY